MKNESEKKIELNFKTRSRIFANLHISHILLHSKNSNYDITLRERERERESNIVIIVKIWNNALGLYLLII